MEASQRAEIGQRIRDLRETSSETNRSIADYVGVGERSVANWIAGDTGITYKNAKKVAELFGVDVRWLWDGKERTATPDPFATPVRGSDGELATLRLEVASLRNELRSELASVRVALEALQSQLESAPRSRAAKGK